MVTKLVFSTLIFFISVTPSSILADTLLFEEYFYMHSNPEARNCMMKSILSCLRTDPTKYRPTCLATSPMTEDTPNL